MAHTPLAVDATSMEPSDVGPPRRRVGARGQPRHLAEYAEEIVRTEARRLRERSQRGRRLSDLDQAAGGLDRPAFPNAR